MKNNDENSFALFEKGSVVLKVLSLVSMDAMPQSRTPEGGTNESSCQSECISSQPVARLSHPPQNTEGGNSGEDSSAISLSVSDTSCLLPAHTDLAPPPQEQKEKWTHCDVINNADSSSVTPPPACTCPHPLLVSSTCNLPPPPHQHLSSSKSHASFKVDAAHIKEVSGDDCCVHCLLGCLFCEMLSMCSAVGACVPCAGGGAGCCAAADDCCCCCMEAACTGEACQALSDCGMLEECCSSADCLEICLECCSICFPS
ncbi:myoD family inhibitor domain-containing protein isoform X2 [Dunckerocampus dactyliophorus]|uniref:myoD family inhibitor domain-containing protein isoform X2 n=1 Tax=Dunckerocampus dactyliophorus TaxID=161453 RepID=UPI002404DFA4|nr:myoD family inhibitor domain-containing protein isoform X2 [Dunckerocampus dactyliophorus]